jgi:hypothetical protein
MGGKTQKTFLNDIDSGARRVVKKGERENVEKAWLTGRSRAARGGSDQV